MSRELGEILMLGKEIKNIENHLQYVKNLEHKWQNFRLDYSPKLQKIGIFKYDHERDPYRQIDSRILALIVRVTNGKVIYNDMTQKLDYSDYSIGKDLSSRLNNLIENLYIEKMIREGKQSVKLELDEATQPIVTTLKEYVRENLNQKIRTIIRKTVEGKFYTNEVKEEFINEIFKTVMKIDIDYSEEKITEVINNAVADSILEFLIKDRDEYIKNLKNTIEKKDKEIEQKDKEIEKLRSRIEELEELWKYEEEESEEEE
ncbi:MAG: hypothetical protein QW669_03760 [Desulfurococcaceae archaeon]